MRPTTRCDPQARPLASFVDNTIDLPWRNFLSPGFGAKFQMEVGPGASKPYKRWSKCTMKKIAGGVRFLQELSLLRGESA